MIARSQKSSQIQNQVQRPPNQQISLIMAELSRADSVAPPLNEIVSAIKEITDPHGLGVQLRVKDYQLEIFEKNHPGDVERQKFEVIKHWRNNSECSWDALACAVEKMGKHGNLVTQLRERHLQALGMSKAKVIKTDTYIQESTDSMRMHTSTDTRTSHACPTIGELKKYVRKFVGDKWEELAIELGLDEDEESAKKLEEIRTKREDNSSMASYDVLMLWQASQNTNPTWEGLKRALIEVDLVDAVKSINEYLGDEEEMDTDPSPTVSSMTATHQKSTVVSKQVKPTTKRYEIRMKPRESVRDYQHELAAPGINGDNYIVTAPTNSGKTLVSALVMADHLKKHSQQKRTAKIVVVVKTRPLADQQRKRLAEYIPDANVECCTGYKGDAQQREKQVQINSALSYSDIVVCTAGKLRDELTKEQVSLRHFSLMILDECHNAEKSSNYAQIMHIYLEQKAAVDGRPLPQVMGLTATPGIGRNPGMNTAKAVDDLINLCALMDASSGIKTVQEYEEELNSIVKKPEYHQEIVDQSEWRYEFIDKVEEKMLDCEKFLNFDSAGKLPRWSQKYEQAIKEERTRLEENENADDRDKVSAVRLLECYSQTLINYIELPRSQAMNPLNEYDDLTSSDRLSEHEKYLLEEFTKLKSDLATLQLVENPILEKLEKRLTNTFTRKPESEGIVFVRTREQAEAITDWISNSEFAKKLKIESHILVGHKREGEKGRAMSDEEQKRIVEAFHAGEYNLLIATSVAEEGLDIKRCNLVMRLHISSAKSKAQMQGRARAVDSEIVTIVSNDPRKLYRDMMNDEQLLLMERLIRNGFLPTRELLQERIATIQTLIRELLKKQKELQEARRNSHPAHTIELKCKKCKDVACRGSDIYIVDKTNHHVVPAGLCYDVSEHPRAGFLDGCGSVIVNKHYKINCTNCNACWGILGTWPSKREFPILKCDYFNFFQDGRPVRVTKWSEKPFSVSPLSEWFAGNGQAYVL